MPPRRPQSKQKLPNKQTIQKKPPATGDDTEAAEKFKVELQWCVQQIEAALQKASLKEKEDMTKAHRTLTSSKASLIKKRQVMNSLFGDYRAKMAKEEVKMKTEAPKLKKQSAIPSKSVFLRKSAHHLPTTTDPKPDPQDADKSQAASGIESHPPGGGTESSILDAKEQKESIGEETSVSEKNVGGNLSEEKSGKFMKPSSTHFKFPTESGSEFKFNFSAVS